MGYQQWKPTEIRIEFNPDEKITVSDTEDGKVLIDLPSYGYPFKLYLSKDAAWDLYNQLATEVHY